MARASPTSARKFLFVFTLPNLDYHGETPDGQGDGLSDGHPPAREKIEWQRDHPPRTVVTLFAHGADGGGV